MAILQVIYKVHVGLVGTKPTWRYYKLFTKLLSNICRFKMFETFE